ncbi:MAG TPA: AbrB/MazE/SpoVT family DNA-binding domain-containing protein [Tepidisphaeraceae bacterium]|jgi:AbrB family looped-hinge helix DNA binding protein
MQAILDDQGRVEIPRELRERLHLTPGDVVDLTVVDSTLSLAPVSLGGNSHHRDAKLVRDGTLLLLVRSNSLNERVF